MKRRTLLAGILQSSGLAAALGASAQGRAQSSRSAAQHPAACAESVEVVTRDGRVRGLRLDGVTSFKGLPYGASTAGASRFLPPQPVTPWSGTRDATGYGPIAPQENVWEKVRLFSAGGYDGVIPVHRESMSEDCLRLNLWTPGIDRAARRPIMVWLHGGSFVGGSGNADWYDGSNLSRRGDVVVATVNHRVGTLGCLYLGERLGRELAASGLNGMLDIVLALRWLKDNAAAFGGDPDNITIFGESGGGWKVSALLAMPNARGLFHRAIIQSGPGVRMHTPEQADRVTRLFLEEVGLPNPSLQQLQALPIDQIIAAQQRLVTRVRSDRALEGIAVEYWPVIDGEHLPAHPFDPVAPAVSADVPLIIGTNETDASWGIWRDAEVDSLQDDAQLAARLARDLGARAAEAVRVYRSLYPDATARELFVRIRSSPHRSITIAERKAALKRAPAYMYLFAWNTPSYGGTLGSPHMLDVPFVFDNVNIAAAFTGGGEDARTLAATLSEVWSTFARTGVPSARGLPRWPAYDAARRSTLVIGDRSRVVDDPGAAARRFWQAAG